MPGNTNFVTDLASFTFQESTTDIIDNISKENLILNTFMKKMENYPGGTQMEHIIYYRFNTTAGYHSGTETIDTTTQNNHTKVTFTLAAQHAGISIDGLSMAKNKGKAQLVSLMKGKVADTTAAVKDMLNKSFFSDGTAHSGKEFLGFEAMIDTDNTYGGINRSTAGNEFWQSQVNSTGGVLTLDMLRTQNRNQARGNDEADIHITTGVLRDKYESLLFPSVRMTDRSKGNASFKTLAFNSSDAMVGYDNACPSGYWYMLNTKYIHVYKDPENFMTTTPFTEKGDNNQDAITSLMLTYMMVTCDRAEAQGKITSVTV